MNTLLLPHAYKKIGWVLLVPSILLGLVFVVLDFNFPAKPTINTFGLFGKGLNIGQVKQPAFRISEIELIPNLISVLLLIGGMFVMFSKEKKEDEFINQIRLHSLQFAVFINYSLLLLCILFIHGFPFLDVMVYNMFTVIFIYILRFHFLLRNNSIAKNEQ
jgi:xanthosine utilization system XapX-like protein